MKKICSLFLAVVLFVSAFGNLFAVSAAQQTYMPSNIIVDVYGKHMTVKTFENSDGVVLVPADILSFVGGMYKRTEGTDYVYSNYASANANNLERQIRIKTSGSWGQVVIQVPNKGKVYGITTGFDCSYTYNGNLYLPLHQVVPFIDAKIEITTDGILHIYPNPVSIFDAIAAGPFTDLDSVNFDVDNVIGGEFIGISGMLLDSIVNQRWDRLDIIFNTGAIKDYKKIFEKLLVENKTYSAAFDEDKTPFDKKVDIIIETINSAGDFVEDVDDILGDSEKALKYMVGSEKFKNYSEFSDDIESLGNFSKAVDGINKIANYANVSLNLVDDHQEMLYVVYNKNNASGTPANTAANEVADMYSLNSANVIKSTITSALRDYLVKEASSTITKKITPYAIALDAVKLLLPGAVEVIGDSSNIYYLDAIVEDSENAYNTYYNKLWLDETSLDNIRLSLIMALVSSKYSYDLYYGELEDTNTSENGGGGALGGGGGGSRGQDLSPLEIKRHTINDWLEQLYLAADSVECTTTDYYLNTCDELEANISFLRKEISISNSTIAARIDQALSLYGPGQYFSKNGEPSITCNNSDSVNCVENGPDCNCLRYAKINGKTVDLTAVQCMGYARYWQYMLFGSIDDFKGNNKKFSRLNGVSGKLSASSVEEWFLSNVGKLHPGTHIRCRNSEHSIVLISADFVNGTITYIECNWDKKCGIEPIKTISYSDFASRFNTINFAYVYENYYTEYPNNYSYTEPTSATIAEGTYYLNNDGYLMYMKADAKKTTDVIGLSNEKVDAAFKFKIVKDGSYYRIYPTASTKGYVLHSWWESNCNNKPHVSGPTANGDEVALWSSIANDTSQMWSFEKCGNGYLIHPGDAPNLSITRTEDNRLYVTTTTKAANQIWTLEDPSQYIVSAQISNGNYYLNNNGFRMFMKEESRKTEDVIHASDESVTAAFSFTIEKDGSGYRIYPTNSLKGYVLHAWWESNCYNKPHIAGPTINGDEVALWNKENDNSQRWIFEEYGDGYLIHPMDAKNLSITRTDDNRLYVTTTTGNENQIWTLEITKHNYQYEYSSEYHYQKCVICGDELEMSEHIWNEGDVSAAPTYVSEGVMTFSCEVCEAVKHEVIPALEATSSTPKFVVIGNTAVAGGTVKITVSIENNPGIWGTAFSLPIDTEVFEFVSADTNNSVFKQFGICGFDEAKGAYKFNGLNSSFNDITGDGTVVVITLKVKENVEAGEYKLSAKLNERDIINANGEVVSFASVEGTVTVAEYIIGDVNGDSYITNADVLAIFRYIYNPELYPLNVTAADVNHDGDVTNADVLAIFRYIYNPELYPIV